MNEEFLGRGVVTAPVFESRELQNFSRTIAEIEWLLVILVLLHRIVQGGDSASAATIYLGLVIYCILIVGLRYLNLYRHESRWKLAIETWAMVGLITWILLHEGRLDSPLVSLYLLPIIISALTLGKLVTLLEVGLIAACYVLLGFSMTFDSLFWLNNFGDFMTKLAPMLLVAYITTMLSADIRSALLRIKVISEIDELTGIYNVRAFGAVAERVHRQSQQSNQPYSVVMVDSDNMKTVNDTYGHDFGNRLLKLIVSRMQQNLRETDVLARYGGDEFIVLLPHTKEDGAFEVAERIRKAIATTPLDIQDAQVQTTVSIGIATYPEHGADLALVMNRADHALYASKKRGRNCCSITEKADTVRMIRAVETT